MKMLSLWTAYILENGRGNYRPELGWKFLKMFLYKHRKYSFYNRLIGTFDTEQFSIFLGMAIFAWRHLNIEHLKFLNGEIRMESIDFCYPLRLFKSLQRFSNSSPTLEFFQAVVGDVALSYLVEIKEYGMLFSHMVSNGSKQKSHFFWNMVRSRKIYYRAILIFRSKNHLKVCHIEKHGISQLI